MSAVALLLMAVLAPAPPAAPVAPAHELSPSTPKRPPQPPPASTRGPVLAPRATPTLLEAAHDYLGTPYVYGGEGPLGTDCSGLTMSVFGHAGLPLPRMAQDQARLGWTVRGPIAAGDLLFFTNHPGTGEIEHVAVAVSPTEMIHASTVRHRVVLDPIDTSYYRERLLFVRRLTPAPPRPATTVARAPSGKSPRPAATRAPSASPVAAKAPGDAGQGARATSAQAPKTQVRRTPARAKDDE